MVRASISVNFEAKDRAEVEARLASWKLHEGCGVYATTQEMLDPLIADEEGALVPPPEPELAPVGEPETPEAIYDEPAAAEGS